MSPAESHYLTCQDVNCEKFACVARRDYEQKILVLETDLKDAKEEHAATRKRLFPKVKDCDELRGTVIEMEDRISELKAKIESDKKNLPIVLKAVALNAEIGFIVALNDTIAEEFKKTHSEVARLVYKTLCEGLEKEAKAKLAALEALELESNKL